MIGYGKKILEVVTMKYDFDKIINRKGTNSLKWDFSQKRVGHKDVLPMWVADMDFEAPGAVIEAIQQRAEHGIFGYTGTPDSYYQAVIAWIKKDLIGRSKRNG